MVPHTSTEIFSLVHLDAEDIVLPGSSRETVFLRIFVDSSLRVWGRTKAALFNRGMKYAQPLKND